MDGFREFFIENISEQEAIYIYSHNPNLKVKEISVLTGKSIGEIYRILHSHNIMPNRQKINHNNVINLANFGYLVPQIAELTGYTARNVRYILAKERRHE